MGMVGKGGGGGVGGGYVGECVIPCISCICHIF